jgi:hypothetical protein
MLEFFRRHRGPFLIGLTIIIILAFGVWGAVDPLGGNPNDPFTQGAKKAFSVYGVDYTQNDVARMSKNLRLAYSLQMFDLAFGLPNIAQRQRSLSGGEPTTDFVANLLVMREQALKHGVAASDEDIMKAFEALQPFQKDGKYDPVTAETYLNNLRANGFQPSDVKDLIRDQIVFEKLREIIGANYIASPLEVDKAYASDQQTLKASTVLLSLEDFKKKAEVKDDEIAKYYEENKESYMTTERRAAQYVRFTRPTPDAAKKAEENAQADKDWDAMVGGFYTKFTDPKADLAKLIEEVNQQITEKTKAANAAAALAAAAKKAEEKKAEEKKDEAKKPEDKVAEDKKPEEKKEEAPKPIEPVLVKLETIALTDEASVPEAIKSEAELVKELFRTSLAQGQPSDPINTSTGYAFLRVTQIEAPKQQELKEVSDKIKETLVSQKANEAITNAAKEAKTLLADALKAGKKWEDVVKDKGWKVESLPEFSKGTPPAGNPNGSQIAEQAARTAVMGVSDPISVTEGQLLVIVTAKELRKNEGSSSLKEGQLSSRTAQGKEAYFRAWFGKKRDEAKVDLYFDPAAEAS